MDDLVDNVAHEKPGLRLAMTLSPSASSSTRRPIFMISTEAKSKDQIKPEARQAYLKYLLEKARDEES
ncbi:MAG: hypothetical protein ACLQIK_15395 [Mycobacterium sp.]|uniref:hypothetical protein n=1 Tax=Mycobacterium sp. TaxID=1785 RepID=UPI003F9BBCCF